MQINELQPRILDRRTLEKFIDCPFVKTIYGECDNYLFVITNNGKCGVINTDTNKYEFIISPTYSLIDKFIHPFLDVNNNQFFRYLEGYYVDVDSSSTDYILKDVFGKKVAYCLNETILNKSGKVISKSERLTYFDFNFEVANDTKTTYAIYNQHIYRLKMNRNFQATKSKKNLRYSGVPKFNDDISRKKIVTEKWNIMSDYKYGLSIICKDDNYGVIDNTYKVVFDYDKDIKNIDIISPDTLVLKNNENKKALYKIGSGYIINFDDNIKFDNAQQLNNNIYKLKSSNKEQLVINGKIFSITHEHIYLADDIVVLEDKNKTIFLDITGNEILSINSNNFFKSSSNIYYNDKSNNDIYQFNIKEKKKKLIIHGYSIKFKTEDGNILEDNIDNIIQNYNFYYLDNRTNELILFKKKKYGLQIIENSVSHIKWFDTPNQMYTYQNLLLDSILNFIDTSNIDNKQKVLKLNNNQ